MRSERIEVQSIYKTTIPIPIPTPKPGDAGGCLLSANIHKLEAYATVQSLVFPVEDLSAHDGVKNFGFQKFLFRNGEDIVG